VDYWQARQGIWRDELNDWRELQRYRDSFLVNMFIPEHGRQSTIFPIPLYGGFAATIRHRWSPLFSLAGGWHT